MTLLDLAVAAAVVLGAVLVVLAIGAVLRQSPPSRAAALAAGGDFEGALAAADSDGRDDRLAAAVAAKHLLDFERAEALLASLLAAGGGAEDDGEAWLERGLVAAYRGERQSALDAFARAAAERSDLLEPISLHRAWLALEAGETARARALFEEIEAPIETKLRSDIGPGDPLFAEWFAQAADLWEAQGDLERASWARRSALASAPESRLVGRLALPAAERGAAR